MNHGPVLSFAWRRWEELDTDELYGLLRLRQEVFVVEQACAYQDLDGLDSSSLHLLATVGEALAGYIRLLPPGLQYQELPAIGRVVTSPAFRGQGLGRPLMEEGWLRSQVLWGPTPVKLGAQSYLQDFYNSLGYRVCGPGYDEDGIPHLPMLKEP